MTKLTFDDIRNNGLLLYEFIRGSKCHGIDTPTSDTDMGGVYMAPVEQLIGLGIDYQDQVSDDKHDTTWHELNKYMNLLLKSNPTVLESLFVDQKFVIYEHPIITELKLHRDEFVTKECFPSFYGYAKAQIERARGLNKKIVNPITERKKPIDFCYTFYNQGSMSIEDWLKQYGLKQEYCGLVSLNHIKDGYSVFYDWGAHIQNEKLDINDLMWVVETWFDSHNGNHLPLFNMIGLIVRTYAKSLEMALFVTDGTEKQHYQRLLKKWYDKYNKPFGYRGIQKSNGNDVHCSSIPKLEPPIAYITYNRDGYSTHCKKYKEYVDWEKKRNPIRYEGNLNKNYDAKNMCECFRLINMGIEIASGQGVKVNRHDIDRDFLLDVKNHKYEYDELIKMVQDKTEEMNNLMKNSNLPEKIDYVKINQLLINIRKKQLGIK